MAQHEPKDVVVTRIDLTNRELLSRVADDVFDAAIEPTRLTSYLSVADHALFVALDGTLVVGQVRGVLHHQPDVPSELYIDNLGVTPSHQRRGIATALVKALTRWAEDKGCATLWVATESDNAGGRAFYRALGLQEQTLSWFAGTTKTLNKC